MSSSGVTGSKATINWDVKDEKELSVGGAAKKSAAFLIDGSSLPVRQALKGQLDTCVDTTGAVATPLLKGSVAAVLPIATPVVNASIDYSVPLIGTAVKTAGHKLIDSKVEGSLEFAKEKADASVDSSIEFTDSYYSRFMGWMFPPKA